MAKTHTGEAYYDAGTINEQLDDYEVYEQNGRLFLNKEGADPQEYVSFDGINQLLGGFRTTQPGKDEVGADETLLYVIDDGADMVLEAAHNDDGNMIYAAVATFSTAGGE